MGLLNPVCHASITKKVLQRPTRQKLADMMIIFNLQHKLFEDTYFDISIYGNIAIRYRVKPAMTQYSFIENKNS